MKRKKKMKNPLERLMESWKDCHRNGINPMITKGSLRIIEERTKLEESDIKNFEQWTTAQGALRLTKIKLENIKPSTRIKSSELKQMISDLDKAIVK